MPGGVQTRFLQVLALDHQVAGRRSIVLAALLVVLLVPAWFLAPPLGAAVFVGAAVIGIVTGVLLSRSRSKRYETSIKGHWSHWMRFATACETVPEIYTRVHGGSTRNRGAVTVTLLTALWAFEILLIAIAFQEEAGLALVAPLLALNGIVVGALTGHAFHQRRWYDGLHGSVQELVETGEIGVWGVL